MPHYKRVNLPGYERIYAVSRTGKLVRRIPEFPGYEFVKQTPNIGYMQVRLYHHKYEDGDDLLVHRIVALTYIRNPKPNKYNVVNHIDGNPGNNSDSNLEWCTQKINVKKGKGNGNTHHTPVLQYDFTGTKFIKRYDCINDAAEAMGVGRHAIGKVCSGANKRCRDYVFKYENDNREFLDTSVEHRPLKEFPDSVYLVSKDGRIYNTLKNRYLKPFIDLKGIQSVTIYSNKNRHVSRLVAEAFMKIPYKHFKIYHKNNDPSDNRLENLKVVQIKNKKNK